MIISSRGITDYGSSYKEDEKQTLGTVPHMTPIMRDRILAKSRYYSESVCLGLDPLLEASTNNC